MMSFTLMHLILRVCYRSFIRQTYLFLFAVFVREIFLLSGTPRSGSSTVLSNISKAWNPMPLHRISSVGWHFSTIHSILLNSAARELLMHNLRNQILVQRAHNSRVIALPSSRSCCLICHPVVMALVKSKGIIVIHLENTYHLRCLMLFLCC